MPVFLLLLTASIYIFVPGQLDVSRLVIINCAKNPVTRTLLDERKWQQWWPHRVIKKDTGFVASNKPFTYNGYSYQITKLFTDKIEVFAIHGLDTLSTVIYILPLNKNSVTLQWKCILMTGMNPLKRVLQCRKAVHIKNNMVNIFAGLKAFLENTTNVYGFPIREIISQDSTLIAIRYMTVSYPGTYEIYRLIDTLKTFIARHDATETNYPMMRVTTLSDSQFQIMAAIPTNKKLQGNDPFFFQRFVPYKTLTCTVKGGEHAVNQGFRQMEIFVEDYQRTPMAVPFQSLITNRTTEPDTTKWVTIICQPVS